MNIQVYVDGKFYPKDGSQDFSFDHGFLAGTVFLRDKGI